MAPEASIQYGGSSAPKRVVIAGAGPGGVLAALFLLGRNDYDAPNGIKYHVTLVDDRENFGKVNIEDLSKHRSWMIGLASHGLTAIREIPGLFEDYVSKVGVALESFSIHIGPKEIKSTDTTGGAEGYIVDRNYVVWALTKALTDRYQTKEAYSPMYNTKLLFVDSENKAILVRGPDKEEYLDYDILIGCDGIRSVVRGAILQRERMFECRVSDIFNTFKAVHVESPKDFDLASLHLMPNCLPNFNGIALPEKGGYMNISMGHYCHKDCDEELKSDDPAVVAAYVKKNFKAAELVDYDDFAHQWVNQPWNTTGQVHCNFYHSEKVGAIIMGDAAHATSPSIGMGMNTALADAAALNRLLDECKDDWSQVMPAFSKERVKEGRALTDLAFYLFSMNESQALQMVVGGVIRSALSKYLPFIWSDPQQDIGMGAKLSVVYDRATKLGILPAVRRTNDALRLKYEEEQFGMVTKSESRSIFSYLTGMVFAVGVLGALFAYMTGPASPTYM